MANYGVIFADGSDAYTFDLIQRWSPDFADGINATVRTVGMSGGIDQFGGDDAPDAVKSIVLTFYLWAETTAEMQTKRDAVTKLKALGTRKLYWQPQGTANQRWCYAKVDNVRMSQDREGQGDLMQLVQINFHVSEPRWYETEESQVVAVSGTSTDAVITNNGSAPAQVRVNLFAAGAAVCENPTIRRIVSAVAVEEMSYVGIITGGNTLIIDTEEKSVEKSAVSVYEDFSADTPHWLWLMPGANTIRFLCEGAGNSAAATVYWKDTYR